MGSFFSINQLIDKVTAFIKLKGEQIKLEIMSRLARAIAVGLSIFLIWTLLMFLALFLCLALAGYLNDIWQSTFLGHLVISGIALLKLIFIIILLKTGALQRAFEQAILNQDKSKDEQ